MAQIRNVILRALAASTEKLAAGGHGSVGGGGTQADAARLAQHTAARVFKECLQARRGRKHLMQTQSSQWKHARGMRTGRVAGGCLIKMQACRPCMFIALA